MKQSRVPGLSRVTSPKLILGSALRLVTRDP